MKLERTIILLGFLGAALFGAGFSAGSLKVRREMSTMVPAQWAKDQLHDLEQHAATKIKDVTTYCVRQGTEAQFDSAISVLDGQLEAFSSVTSTTPVEVGVFRRSMTRTRASLQQSRRERLAALDAGAK